MAVLKEVEQNIKEMRQRIELDGEVWNPADQQIRITVDQWEDVLIDPYLLEAFPDAVSRNDFITTKKLFGVQIVMEE